MGGYKHLFRISNTKKYKAGTSFEEIVSLYKFDAELRELFFKYLLQIERQMRSLMSYYFTEMYGAEQKQYLDANNYNNTKRNHATIVKLIATLKRATTTTGIFYRPVLGTIFSDYAALSVEKLSFTVVRRRVVVLLLVFH